jgi:hypothetical protein
MSEVSWHEAQLITLLAQCVRLTDRHSIIQTSGHAFSPRQASVQRLGRINCPIPCVSIIFIVHPCCHRFTRDHVVNNLDLEITNSKKKLTAELQHVRSIVGVAVHSSCIFIVGFPVLAWGLTHLPQGHLWKCFDRIAVLRLFICIFLGPRA